MLINDNFGMEGLYYEDIRAALSCFVTYFGGYGRIAFILFCKFVLVPVLEIERR